MTDASVRAIVVTYSSGRYLHTFLDSLVTASSGSIPVVVSDNGSTDGSLKGIEQRSLTTVLRNHANLGYGAAANRGAIGASEGWLLVANPDVELTEGSVDTLLAAVETSGANYLITGDKDLLAMAERYPIVAPATFWATHAGL